MSNFLNNANKNWSVVAGQIQNQAANGVVYIKPSAFQIPVGVSNERPTGEAGMIRYLTNDNVIEYYNANTSAWVPISQQPPNPLTITPTQLIDASSGQTQTFTITGTDFVSGCFVEFVGQDDTSYGDDQTNFINSQTIQALFSSSNSIYDASFNEPFSVRVSNPAGLSGTLIDAIVYNARPTFTNAINLGSVDSSQNVLGLLADLTGTDPDSHYPLKFDVSNGSTLPGTIDISNTSDGSGVGVFIGNAPLVSIASTTYNPYFVITDASNNTSFFERFNFTVRGPLNLRTSTAITSGGTIDISFTDSTGTNYISDPSYGGYTIYTFKASNNTTNAVFTFETDNWSDIAECLIVGGGGGGGSCAGGGGAGGFINDNFYFQNGSLYDIQVGGGGTGGAAGNDNAGANGGTSFIGTSTYKLNAFGGGGGAALQETVAGFGGCGGGGGYDIDQGGKSKGSSGATTTLLQGFDGGDGNNQLGGGGYPGGGGGGAGGHGGFVKNSSIGPNGGIGLFSSITGINTGYAGGGGASTLGGGTAGYGGGGPSGFSTYGAADGSANSTSVGNSATPHTGSGGGAGSSTGFGQDTRSGGGAGGSGIVVIKIPSYPLNLGENRLALSNSSLTYDISYVDNAGSYTSSPKIDGETIYIFKQGSGTITPNFTSDCSYLVVAGGGGGGTSQLEDRGAGGGGAGGLQFGAIVLNNSTNYSIQCGAGGVGGEFQILPPSDPNVAGNGVNGGNSVLNGITTIGGGYGAGIKGTPSGGNGGSGGGGRNGGDGGLGTNTQGNNGGGSSTGGGGGGGGYAASGISATGGSGGNGGGGYSDSITGTAVEYAAGGGGGGAGSGSSGGTSQGGGSGAPGYNNSSDVNNSLAGIPNKNTGSGGGGGGARTSQNGQRGNSGSNGSNGVVILRFPSFGSLPTLNSLQISATNGTVDILYLASNNSVVGSPVSGGYSIYSFTCSSNLTTATFTVQPNTSIYSDFLMVAGGGSGSGGASGGGGGAGGVHISTNIGQSTSYSATDSSLNLLSQSYTLTVGGGGVFNQSGSNSSITGSGFSTITSTGGGFGKTLANAGDGGSGGGLGLRNSGGSSPPYSPGSAIGTGLGNNGGSLPTSGNPGGGGGGGALAAGANGTANTGSTPGTGIGGIGITTTIRGSSETFAGGGSAGGRTDAGSVLPAPAQTIGGGGAGSQNAIKASNGTQSKGGGGGGGGFDNSISTNGNGGDGGSGIIVLRIPSFS